MRCVGGALLVPLSATVVAVAVGMALSRVCARITAQVSVLRRTSFALCPLVDVGRLAS